MRMQAAAVLVRPARTCCGTTDSQHNRYARNAKLEPAKAIVVSNCTAKRGVVDVQTEVGGHPPWSSQE